MVGRIDLSQPVDKAEVTRKRVNLGTSDEKHTHFLMETHVYLFTFKYVDCEQCLGGCYSKKFGKSSKSSVLCPL